MMTHPSMTSRGRLIAAVIGIAFAFCLPKHVDCGVPDRDCAVVNAARDICHPYEVEPFGFYLLELVVHRDVGFAYSSSDGCP